MLHRLALRVLPQLCLAVTEETVRGRKRLVMGIAGFVAFVVYRVMKLGPAPDNALSLFLLCGALSSVTALTAFRAGYRKGFVQTWREVSLRELVWIGVWIGFAYGIQLGLMVLALLKIGIDYDFAQHPDGPAMMALIIAGTSVARDAFEIGHVRALHASGRPILTFPNGYKFRRLIQSRPLQVISCLLAGSIVVAANAALITSFLGQSGTSPLVQLAVISLLGGTVALWAYLAGAQQTAVHKVQWGLLRWRELFRFWWWPGLAFSATYYLVLAGAVLFLVPGINMKSAGVSPAIAGIIGALMAMYGYYLGQQRYRDDQVRQAIPSSLLRCPFVMGILSRHKYEVGIKGDNIGVERAQPSL